MQEFYIEKYIKLPARCKYYDHIGNVEIGKIIEIRNILKDEITITEIIEVHRIISGKEGYKHVKRLRMYDIMMVFNFVVKGLEYIVEKEQSLDNDTDAKKQKAGIENLYKFNDLNIIKEVADFCNLQLESAENVTWTLAFSIIYRNSETAKFERNYMKEIQKD